MVSKPMIHCTAIIFHLTANGPVSADANGSIHHVRPASQPTVTPDRDFGATYLHIFPISLADAGE